MCEIMNTNIFMYKYFIWVNLSELYIILYLDKLNVCNPYYKKINCYGMSACRLHTAIENAKAHARYSHGSGLYDM